MNAGFFRFDEARVTARASNARIRGNDIFRGEDNAAGLEGGSASIDPPPHLTDTIQESVEQTFGKNSGDGGGNV